MALPLSVDDTVVPPAILMPVLVVVILLPLLAVSGCPRFTDADTIFA